VSKSLLTKVTSDMMERRMRGNSHVRCEVGENLEITSKSYLSPYIPQRILKVMKNNKFLENFSYVELDSDTDLEKFSIVEKEFLRIRKLFNMSEVKKAELRIRKLGKHKALGLYYPGLRCLCVDITSPSSFMHEFGHRATR